MEKPTQPLAGAPVPEPGFRWVRRWTADGDQSRVLVFTCPICLTTNIEPETIPPLSGLISKYRLGFCTTCDSFVRTPTDAV